jgi:hypothetical protein
MPKEGMRTDPGVGGGKAVSRERTVLGTGASRQPPGAPVAPIVVLAPTREKTVLGVAPPVRTAALRPPAREISQQEPAPEGWDLPPASTDAVSVPAILESPRARASAQEQGREPSIAIDLSELERSTRGLTVDPSVSEASLVAAGVPRRRGRGWLALLVLAVLAAAGGLGYLHRDRVQPIVMKWEKQLVAAWPR